MRSRTLILLSALVFFVLFCPPAGAVSDKDLFASAEKARSAFEKDKKARQLRHKWINVIEDYEKVVKTSPGGKYAEKSYMAIGDLYFGLAEISRRSSDFDYAVDNYRNVTKRFTNGGLAARAQLNIGKILLKHKNDPDKAYVELLKVELNHPKYKNETAEARKLMAKISGSARYENVKPSESASIPTPPPAAEPVENDGKARVTGVRYWHNDSYSRVAIDIDSEVTFKDHLLRRNEELNTPMRLYMDIEKSRVASGIQDEIKISDGLLSRARVAQYDKDTVRVVLDIQNIYNYRIFSLTNPYRIVVDVTGEDPEKTETSDSTGVAKANSKETKKEPLTDLRQTAMKRPKKPRGPVNGASKQASLARQLGLGVKKVVIDPGHGGKDRGGAGATGLKEKELTLKLARMLADKIHKKLGLEVVLTRDTDVFLTLEERTAKANTEAADLFISIHGNAHKSASVHGIETYVLNIATDKEAMRVAARENATTTRNMSDLQMILSDLMLNSKIAESMRLGSSVHRSMVKTAKKKYKDVKDLGVKQAPFYVLIGANMPSILVEVGFMTNKTEEKRLKSKKYLENLTDGIVDGIKNYKESLQKAG